MNVIVRSSKVKESLKYMISTKQHVCEALLGDFFLRKNLFERIIYLSWLVGGEVHTYVNTNCTLSWFYLSLPTFMSNHVLIHVVLSICRFFRCPWAGVLESTRFDLAKSWHQGFGGRRECLTSYSAPRCVIVKLSSSFWPRRSLAFKEINGGHDVPIGPECFNSSK